MRCLLYFTTCPVLDIISHNTPSVEPGSSCPCNTWLELQDIIGLINNSLRGSRRRDGWTYRMDGGMYGWQGFDLKSNQLFIMWDKFVNYWREILDWFDGEFLDGGEIVWMVWINSSSSIQMSKFRFVLVKCTHFTRWYIQVYFGFYAVMHHSYFGTRLIYCWYTWSQRADHQKLLSTGTIYSNGCLEEIGVLQSLSNAFCQFCVSNSTLWQKHTHTSILFQNDPVHVYLNV